LHGDNRAQQLTERGDIFGHPEYMSQETARGEPIEARCNIYSLGGIMYSTLAAENPFQGSHWGAILLKKMTDKVPPLETIESDPGLTSKINKIVLKCLEQDPKRRFESIAKLKKELEALKVSHSEPLAYERLRNSAKQNECK
jgi:eukaryotic-like serine/threonine-protein kinase